MEKAAHGVLLGGCIVPNKCLSCRRGVRPGGAFARAAGWASLRREGRGEVQEMAKEVGSADKRAVVTQDEQAPWQSDVEGGIGEADGGRRTPALGAMSWRARGKMAGEAESSILREWRWKNRRAKRRGGREECDDRAAPGAGRKPAQQRLPACRLLAGGERPADRARPHSLHAARWTLDARGTADHAK